MVLSFNFYDSKIKEWKSEFIGRTHNKVTII